jgi:hypothetical protein
MIKRGKIMIRIQKMSLVFLSVVIVVSVGLIFASPKFVNAGLKQKSDVIEITTNKGDSAPGFTLENMNGEKVSLKDFRGNILVLGIAFFPVGEEAIRNIEKYRKGVISDFKIKGINFLKVMEIKKPVFMKKEFILSKMKKQLEGIPEAPKNTLIDWGGALNLYKKYGIKDKKLPSLFVIGKDGKIVYAFQDWYNEDNLNRLEKEAHNILK